MGRAATWLPIALICAASPPASLARSPAGTSGAEHSAAFVQQSWTARDGLPINSITDIHQSHTGYLWLTTFDGLVRFDGVRFTIYNAANSSGRREIQVTAQLQHPHIVPLLSAGEHEDIVYYTMPFIAGESLKQSVEKGGPMLMNDVVRREWAICRRRSTRCSPSSRGQA